MIAQNVLFAGFVSLLFVACCTDQVAGQGRSPTEDQPISNRPSATETVESLKRKILETTQKLESIRVCCLGEYAHRALADANAFYRVALCAKAPHFLFYDSAHGHDSMNWKLDPHRQRAYVQKGQVYNEYPLDRMFFRQPLKPQDPLPGSLQTAFFFLATGHWPMTDREAPRYADLPYVLRDVALSKQTHLHLRLKLEQVDGRWCHVLEQPGVDCLWIDTERAGCLVQRELSDAQTGQRLQRYRLLEQEKFSDQIWVPGVIENTVFRSNDPAGNSGSEEITSRTRVVECAVNQVDDTVFDYHIPAGALEFNETNLNEPPRQVAAGGLDQFDQMTEWIQGDLISTITVAPARPTLSGTAMVPFSTLALLVVLVLALIFVCELYLRFFSCSD
ncbi:MAG: hypothetical protein P8N76_08095 [Pirellulaceae bacterium]|nr:hypothetical protein [Pirellulaceae bacterium]